MLEEDKYIVYHLFIFIFFCYLPPCIYFFLSSTHTNIKIRKSIHTHTVSGQNKREKKNEKD